MKRDELIDLLNGAKALSSQVDIDKMIECLYDLEITSHPGSIRVSDLDKFINSVANRLDSLSGEDVVQYSSAEFELDSCNTVQLVHIEPDFSDIAETIRDLMTDQFLITAE